MKVRKNFEAVFLVAATVLTLASVATASVPETTAHFAPAAKAVTLAYNDMPVVEIKGKRMTQVVEVKHKRLTAEEKAQLN